MYGDIGNGDILTLCGKEQFKELIPVILKSIGNTANVDFSSNADGITGSGFRIKYWAERTGVIPTGPPLGKFRNPSRH